MPIRLAYHSLVNNTTARRPREDSCKIKYANMHNVLIYYIYAQCKMQLLLHNLSLSLSLLLFFVVLRNLIILRAYILVSIIGVDDTAIRYR